ncbi:MAG: hypothetical protein D3925_15380 [Candidatus Electrothrix sp. AR5]|nr:hypothetical protein [Candidatus Electrothrix sp. AR5]
MDLSKAYNFCQYAVIAKFLLWCSTSLSFYTLTCSMKNWIINITAKIFLPHFLYNLHFSRIGQRNKHKIENFSGNITKL